MKNRKAVWKRMIRDEHGFTLLEVMIAGVLLAMIVSFFFAGISYVNRVQLRILNMEGTGRLVEEAFADKSNCIPGSVSLQFEDGTVIERNGWLYDGTDSDGNSMEATYILTEEWGVVDQTEEDEMP